MFLLKKQVSVMVNSVLPQCHLHIRKSTVIVGCQQKEMKIIKTNFTFLIFKFFSVIFYKGALRNAEYEIYLKIDARFLKILGFKVWSKLGSSKLSRGHVRRQPGLNHRVSYIFSSLIVIWYMILKWYILLISGFFKIKNRNNSAFLSIL